MREKSSKSFHANLFKQKATNNIFMVKNTIGNEGNDSGNEGNENIDNVEIIVPDTSIIIERIISAKLENKDIIAQKVVIHEAVVAELEHQANQDKAIGFLGIDEIGKLKQLSSEIGFEIEFSGKRPSAAEIKYATLGEIDALIRELAYELGATLITADKIQAKVAKAKGIDCIHVEFVKAKKKLMIEEFFDETTMSVHLREGVEPYAKKGMPGMWDFVCIKKSKLKADEIKNIATEIIEEAGIRHDSFVEIERPGSTIVQLGLYRIVILRTPFSDGHEITAVRPVTRLELADYKLSEKLSKRIKEQAEGILIAGSPGMGKSTFAQALAKFYAEQGKIVKTIEAPRDMVLPDSVTQMAISHGDAQEVHDILLLSRPDNTMFDEMRNTADFILFADLRLAGIGLAGVVHATNPIDAIQRFVGRIELGVIPQVIDTVIFIKNGGVEKVLNLEMTVKVPAGMTEADLARPVVVVNDFETNKQEFELYSYGEETVVIPVKGDAGKTPSQKLAAKSIKNYFNKFSEDVEVEVISDNKCVVYVPEREISKIIGKQGKRINEIESELGLSIDVQELKHEKMKKEDGELKYDVQFTKSSVMFKLPTKHQNKDCDIYIDGDLLLSAKTGKSGIIKIKSNNRIGKILFRAVNKGEDVKIFLVK